MDKDSDICISCEFYEECYDDNSVESHNDEDCIVQGFRKNSSVVISEEIIN